MFVCNFCHNYFINSSNWKCYHYHNRCLKVSCRQPCSVNFGSCQTKCFWEEILASCKLEFGYNNYYGVSQATIKSLYPSVEYYSLYFRKLGFCISRKRSVKQIKCLGGGWCWLWVLTCTLVTHTQHTLHCLHGNTFLEITYLRLNCVNIHTCSDHYNNSGPKCAYYSPFLLQLYKHNSCCILGPSPQVVRTPLRWCVHSLHSLYCKRSLLV